MKYEIKVEKLEDLLDVIIVPDYQRQLVWKQNNIDRFIESLLINYPIGVLTVAEEKNKYFLIDGLQRFSTIENFLSTPSKYYSFKKISNYLNLRKKLNSISEDNIEKILKEIKSMYDQLLNIKYQNKDELYKLEDKIREILDNHEYNTYFRPMIDDFWEKINLRELSLPIIYCSKYEEEDLPELFYRMNTGMVKLSKYEVYASKWFSKYKYLKFSSEGALYKKISKLKKEMIKEMKLEKTKDYTINVTYSDYFLSLSQEINNLYGDDNAKKKEVGYEIFSLICKEKAYFVDGVVKELNSDNRSLVEITNFLEGIYTSINDVVLYLRKKDIDNELEKILLSNEKVKDKKVSKFTKYFYFLHYYFQIYEIDFNTLTINRNNINLLNDEFLKFDTSSRQVTNINMAVFKMKRKKLEEREVIKIFNIHHAGKPFAEDQLRIQVKPTEIKKNLDRNEYSGIAGYHSQLQVYVLYENNYVTNSLAINRSLYISEEVIFKFSKSNEKETIIDNQEIQIKLMQKEIFESKYYRYGEINE